MENIAFWLLLTITLAITAIIIKIRKYKLMDFIMAISLVGASAIIDKLLSSQFQLYYYVDYDNKLIYSSIYDLLIYPCYGIMFSVFMPGSRKYKSAAYYILSWTVFLTFVEAIVVYPFHIVIYTGWWIFPYSPIFYVVGLTITYIYYQIVENKFAS
ncbi:hypothetical protein [Clostridium sp. HMP27]|uniref:hypothetical protein n=1 Tax=Clostridium sp. HMP27 TaxID=1487921 RepID=UPI00052DCF3E|nr:hypothetical protein [Clostridium sp. HMP27]KGK85987.1 hypothetical protein DP68_14215 [Clostridium sp. HMP27]